MDVRTEREVLLELEALEARLEAIAQREDYGRWIHCFGDDTTPETAEQQALLAEVKALIVRRGELGMELHLLGITPNSA
jgi:hypothetical protein